MGAVCCCLRDECEDYADINSSVYRNCLCLRFFVQGCIHMRGEEQTNSSVTQGTGSFSSTTSENSLSDMYRSPPRPLPYDADTRYFRLQQDGLVSRREKGTSHSQEECNPLRISDSDADSEPLVAANKWNESTSEEESKEYDSKSAVRLSMGRMSGVAHIYTSSEDEDVCPTCLEEYSIENPKIITKCSHHYHLGCIYEWMERSDSCPVCGAMMEFDETT
ncbi:E3 ubiquitin-protein ligase At3g02290 isoform X2 [Daucus carota subsp. sativus]|uniref:E3 ubiquitin-protein ligase At3g02290 isoform X2 n=1 Tax=Daucus carota subsp. sativus TaxID=79200 RepID=UPI0007EFA04F|nr:PREDICTED: E3 ubiquitin-protein ligase At3g02290-like isoform X2 [Daucus carota subsp. sativus]